MIYDLSPFARRTLAIGVFISALLLAMQLVVMPIIEHMKSSLDALANSRYQLDKLEALSARREPNAGEILVPGTLFVAKNSAQAETQLVGQLQATASERVELQNVNALGKQGVNSIIAVEIIVTGEEVSVIDFIEQLESGLPLIKLRSWEIEMNPSVTGQLRLKAIAVGAWVKK